MKALLILLTLTAPLFARIGETPIQCNQRYGEPLKVDREQNFIIYQRAGMKIAIQFWNGVAAQMMIFKAESNVLGIAEKMSDAERDALLTANSGGSEWETTGFMENDFKTKDGKRAAKYTLVENHLLIATTAFLQHEAAERAAKEKAALEGF